MTIRWTRAALDTRLAALEQKHSGQELVEALVSFADTLTVEDKKLFQEVLLERAGRERQAPGLVGGHWTDDMRWRLFGGTPPRRRRRRGG